MGWYEAIKDGISVAQKADNIELVQTLIGAQKEMLDLVDENRRLRDRIRELETPEDISRRLRFDGKRYWLDRDGKEDGPYCSICFDHDRKLIRLTNGEMVGVFWCGVCTTKRR